MCRNDGHKYQTLNIMLYPLMYFNVFAPNFNLFLESKNLTRRITLFQEELVSKTANEDNNKTKFSCLKSPIGALEI